MSDIENAILNQIDSMKNEIIKFHQAIVRIPSENPPAKYKEISNYISNEFENLGLNTVIKRNNAIGTFENSAGPSLII